MVRRIVVAISGASGAGYGLELLRGLHANGEAEVELIVSEGAEGILRQETGFGVEDLGRLVHGTVQAGTMDHPLASGSNPFDSMVICPCSASTASKIACGIADNLITRVAAVALKERRRLVIVLRETPLSTPVLRNLHDLSAWGAIIMPASPPFYGGVSTISDMQKEIAGRVMDLLGVGNDLANRYEPGRSDA